MTTTKAGAKNILVVDDEPDVRDLFREVLSMDGHSVMEAKDGPEALDLFKRSFFDLVITDFEMPEMRGDELAARLRELVPNQRIIAVSANWQKSGNRTKVDLCLDKPLLIQDLRAAVNRVLGCG